MPKRKIEDSDDDIPIFGPNSRVSKRKEHLEGSDDDIPLFGPNSLEEKIRQEESQHPLHNEEDVARTAAAEMTRFEGKDTLRVTK